MVSAGAIVGIVIGSIVVVAACGGILYYYRDHIISEFSSPTQQETQEQRQQVVVDQTVPPDYVDHELDPVCVYEHELHPDVVAPVQPILVHSPSADFIIPPEEDPLIASTPSLRGGASFMTFPEASSTLSASTTSPPYQHDEQQKQQQQRMQMLQNIPPPTPTSVNTASLSTPPIMGSPLSITSSPRFINQSMLNMARLASPPSYDVPNRVIARSPLAHPHSHHHHSRSASDACQFMLSPTSTQRAPQDYFGQVRTRSHTFSHPEPYQSPATTVTSATPPPPHHHHHQGETPDTPRYSLEFPSNVPHEHHLEEHQRARVQYAQWEASLYRRDDERQDQQDSHYIQMQDQPFSQIYSPALSTSSSFTPNTRNAVFRSGSPSSSIQGRGRASPGARPRASTIGESSKLLIQRMQTLWRKTSQSPGGAGGSDGFSPRFENSSTPNLQYQQQYQHYDHQQHQQQEMESGFVGLGTEQQQQQGEHQVQQAEAEAESENSDVVVIVVEPQEESNGSSSSSSTSSSSSQQQQEEQAHHEGSSAASMHPTHISITRTPPSEVMDLSIPTISIPLAAS
ncbi:hypothetical protein BGX26_000941 [Mortierella sp. AD094]|nr:hypothetical protein BGX26_000941 [Mortierella sp. AD094]